MDGYTCGEVLMNWGARAEEKAAVAPAGGGSFTSYFKVTVMEYGALRSLGILFVH